MRRHGLAKVITQSAQEVRKPSTTQPSLVQVCRSVKMGWSKGNVTQDAQTAKSPMRLPHCCVCLEPWLQGSRVLVKFPKIDMSAFNLLPLRSARASVHHGRRGRGHDSHDALGSPFCCASLRGAPGLRLSSLVLAWSLGLWLRGGVQRLEMKVSFQQKVSGARLWQFQLYQHSTVKLQASTRPGGSSASGLLGGRLLRNWHGAVLGRHGTIR